MSKILATYKKHKYIFYLILSVIIGLTPILWFRGQLIAGEEFYAVDYARWGEMFSHTWFDRVNFGQPNQLLPFKFQGLFFSLLTHLGISYYFALIFWHISLWVLGSVGCYIFISKVFEKRVSPSVVFLAVIFYTYTPFFLNISPLLSPPRIVFSALPFILLSLYSYHVNPHIRLAVILKLNFILLLASPAFVNLPAGIVLFIPIYLYFLASLIFNSSIPARMKLLFHALVFTLLYLLMNAWWLYPTYQILTTQTDDIKFASSNFKAINASPLYEVLSQFGSWAFREQVGKYYYFNYNQDFYTFPLIFVKYIPILLILIYLYVLVRDTKLKDYKDKITRKFLFYIILFFIISTFLSKGTSGALGGIYELLFTKFPFFWVFREPYLKFLPLVTISSVVLLVGGIDYLITKYKWFSWFIPLFAFCFLLIGFPYYTSRIVWDVNDGSLRSYYIDPPKKVLEFSKNWVPGVGNYLIFPSGGFVEKYSWPSGYSGNRYLMYTNANTINPKSSYAPSDNVANQISFLYTSMFADPLYYPQHAQNFNIAGIISQDSIDSFKNANPVVKDLYKNYVKSEDEYTALYDFKNGDNLFSLINRDTLLKLNSQSSLLYKEAKSIYKGNKTVHYIQNPNIKPDIIELLPAKKKENAGNTTEAIYNLQDFLSGEYYLRIENEEDGSIKTVFGDAQELTKSKELYTEGIKLDTNICCKSLKINSINTNNVELSQPEIFLGYIEKNGNFVEVIDAEASNISAVKYVFKTNDLNIHATYKAMLAGVIPQGTLSQLVIKQIDPIKDISWMVLSGTLVPFNDSLTFDFMSEISYDVSKTVYYEISVQIDYATNNQFKSLSATTAINGLYLEHIYNPNVFINKGPFVYQTLNEVDKSLLPYKKLNSSFYVLDLNGKNQEIIKFAQAYNKNWKLVSINSSEYDLLSKSNIILKFPAYLSVSLRAPNGKSSINLENFANGWDMKELLKEKSQTYAIVYAPEGIYTLFYTICILLLIVYLAILLSKRLKK